MNPEAIPTELRECARWLCWRIDTVDGSPVKVPYQTSGAKASTTDPKTWTTFEKALAASSRYAGIGWVLADPYCGIDLDNCVNESGGLYPQAAKIVSELASYTESSPSWNGLHIIVRGRKPSQAKAKYQLLWVPGAAGRIEIYDRARYFTFTGNAVADAPKEVLDRKSELSALYYRLWPTTTTSVKIYEVSGITDRCRKYLEKCRDSISGQGGHDNCLHAACVCMRFGLSDAEALDMMRWWSEQKSGGEPWNEREIAHKIGSARSKCAAAGEIGVYLRSEPPKNGTVNGTKNGHANGVHHEPEPEGGVSDALGGRFARIADGTWKAAPFRWPGLSGATQALLPGAVTLVCGEPGAGKTFWILSAALGWQEAGIPYAMFELEEDRTYYAQRALAILARNAHLLDAGWIGANSAEAERLRNEHSETLERFGRCIYAAPKERRSLAQLADWYESVAGSIRVAVIDPVTAASTGDRRWIEDGDFVERVKRIALESETSLILVTHPKLGKRKGAPTLDDMAGGADYARFTQTVLVLSDHDPSDPVRIASPFGISNETANRVVHIRKARNGNAAGRSIAFLWNKNTLDFSELGIITSR